MEIEYNAAGNVTKCAANFEIHYLGQQTGLYGQLRYRSTVAPPPPRLPSVTVTARAAEVSSRGYAQGAFVIARSGDLSAPLTVYYKVRGSAVAGKDYGALAGRKVFKAGKRTTQITFNPIPQTRPAGSTVAVKVKLQAQAGLYTVVGGGTSSVELGP